MIFWQGENPAHGRPERNLTQRPRVLPRLI
jgi:hypothetical protein